MEQSYKQVKNELGWADFAVRSDTAIRRHWNLIFCAFSFCWRAYLPPPEEDAREEAEPKRPLETSSSGRGKNQDRRQFASELAVCTAPGEELAGALVGAATLVESMVARAPAATNPRPAGVGR
jgi:hypothetical protein